MHDWLPKELLIIRGTENKAAPVEAEVGGDYIPHLSWHLVVCHLSFKIMPNFLYKKFTLPSCVEAEMEGGNSRRFWMTTLIWNVFCQMIWALYMYQTFILLDSNLVVSSYYWLKNYFPTQLKLEVNGGMQ